MSHLRSRVQKLESTVNQFAAPTGFLRLIQHGEAPTPDQGAEIAEAKATGKFVIIRKIVSPLPH